MNAWQEWLNNKIQSGTLLNFPDYYQKVLAEHGLPDHLKKCQGCTHLVRRKQKKFAGYTEDGRKQYAEEVTVRCTAYGGANCWNPDWPACGGRDKEVRRARKDGA